MLIKKDFKLYFVCGVILILGSFIGYFSKKPTSTRFPTSTDPIPTVYIKKEVNISPSFLPDSTLNNKDQISVTAIPENTQVSYHRICSNMTCISIEGVGPDECNITKDCYHYGCSGVSCKGIPGGGPDTCQYESDCAHTECIEKKCTLIPGKGQDICGTDLSCTHTVCQDGKCVELTGPGSRTCETDSTCVHKECQNGKCVQVNTSGEPLMDSCSSDIWCQ